MNEVNEEEISTMKIKKGLLKRIEALKIHDRQPNEEVVELAIELLEKKNKK